MRFAEIALLLLPFGVFVAWRLLTPAASGPPRILVIGVLASVLAMAVLLFVLWYEEAEPPGVGYVPARLENGRVIPERIEPIASGPVETAAPGRLESGAPGRVESGTSGRGASGVPGPAEPIAPVRVEPGTPGRVEPVAPGRVEPITPGRLEQPGQASPAASTPK